MKYQLNKHVEIILNNNPRKQTSHLPKGVKYMMFGIAIL